MKVFLKALSFVAVLGLAGNALAGDDYALYGTVTEVNAQEMTFSIKNDINGNIEVIKVNPATEFEVKNKSSMLAIDRDVQFDALKVNDWVKVELPANVMNRAIATDVEIYR